MTTLAVFQHEHPWRDLITEHTVYSPHEVKIACPSRFIPGLLVSQSPRFRCPNCRSLSISLEHGELMQCRCGLLFERYGNSLGVGRLDQE